MKLPLEGLTGLQRLLLQNIFNLLCTVSVLRCALIAMLHLSIQLKNAGKSITRLNSILNVNRYLSVYICAADAITYPLHS